MQNSYPNQKVRAFKRKCVLVSKLGEKCSICGYSKNYAALQFHHLNPQEKNFNLDSRHLSNLSMDQIEKESKKVILVCANCHAEIHYPQFTIAQ